MNVRRVNGQHPRLKAILQYNIKTDQLTNLSVSPNYPDNNSAPFQAHTHTPPIVGSWYSKNSSLTNRTTRHDFPTAVSPRSTSLKWHTRPDDIVEQCFAYGAPEPTTRTLVLLLIIECVSVKIFRAQESLRVVAVLVVWHGELSPPPPLSYHNRVKTELPHPLVRLSRLLPVCPADTDCWKINKYSNTRRESLSSPGGYSPCSQVSVQTSSGYTGYTGEGSKKRTRLGTGRSRHTHDVQFLSERVTLLLFHD